MQRSEHFFKSWFTSNVLHWAPRPSAVLRIPFLEGFWWWQPVLALPGHNLWGGGDVSSATPCLCVAAPVSMVGWAKEKAFTCFCGVRVNRVFSKQKTQKKNRNWEEICFRCNFLSIIQDSQSYLFSFPNWCLSWELRGISRLHFCLKVY